MFWHFFVPLFSGLGGGGWVRGGLAEEGQVSTILKDFSRLLQFLMRSCT